MTSIGYRQKAARPSPSETSCQANNENIDGKKSSIVFVMCIMGSINISLHEALPERSERGSVCVCVCVGEGFAKLRPLLVYQILDPIQTGGEGDGSTCMVHRLII